MTSLSWAVGQFQHTVLLDHHSAAERQAYSATASFGGEERNKE